MSIDSDLKSFYNQTFKFVSLSPRRWLISLLSVQLLLLSLLRKWWGMDHTISLKMRISEELPTLEKKKLRMFWCLRWILPGHIYFVHSRSHLDSWITPGGAGEEEKEEKKRYIHISEIPRSRKDMFDGKHFLNNTHLVATLSRCSVCSFYSAKVEHVKTKNTRDGKHDRVEMKYVMGHQRFLGFFFLPWNTIVCVCVRASVCVHVPCFQSKSVITTDGSWWAIDNTDFPTMAKISQGHPHTGAGRVCWLRFTHLQA